MRRRTGDACGLDSLHVLLLDHATPLESGGNTLAAKRREEARPSGTG